MVRYALHIPFNRYGQIEVKSGRFTIRFTTVQQYRDYKLGMARDGYLPRAEAFAWFADEAAGLKTRLDDLGVRIAAAQSKRDARRAVSSFNL